MSAFLQLIEEGSFNLAIQQLREKGNRISNSKNEDGVSALMLATELVDIPEAVELISALMRAGASINKRDKKRRHVLLYACEKGVDPTIFDELLKWNSMRKDALREWWVQCDSNKNGVFVLACESQNFDLVKHVLSIAYPLYSRENFLESRSNHILKALESAVTVAEEDFAIKLVRLSRKFIDEIPDEFEVENENYGEDSDSNSSRTIYITDIFKLALDKGMFHFITKYGAIFNPDSEFKKVIWRWINLNGADLNSIPKRVKKFAESYETENLWKKNKDVALILLRFLKDRYQNDILTHISLFVYSSSLDEKSLQEQENYDRNAQYCTECEFWYVGPFCLDCQSYSGYLS